MTLSLGQPVRDRNPHDASKRDWVGKVVDPNEEDLPAGFPFSKCVLARVEWQNGTRSWIVETRLEMVDEAERADDASALRAVR